MMLLTSLLLLALPSHAEPVTYEAIRARLEEIEPLRSMRVARSAPTISQASWREVAAGEVATGLEEVPGHAARLGWGAAVLDIDLPTMWRALNEDLWHKDIIGMDLVEIVKGKACQDDRQVLMIMPLPLVSDRWWVVQNTVNTRLHQASGGRIWELRWDGVADAVIPGMSDKAKAMVEGKVRVVDNTGSWFLVDLDGEHTLAEYYALTDPGGNVPAGPASSLANGRIDETIRVMERYAQTSTPRCPVR